MSTDDFGRQNGVGLRQAAAQVRVGGAVLLVRRLAAPRRHLDDARLVDDASAAVAFLHDSDDPRAVGGASCRRVVTLHLRTKLSRLLPRKTHQQSTWGGGDERGQTGQHLLVIYSEAKKKKKSVGRWIKQSFSLFLIENINFQDLNPPLIVLNLQLEVL